MKILFTGGATGGHFYPIIAVVQEVNAIVDQRSLVKPELYYCAPTPYNEKALYENELIYLPAPAGKLRLYTSISNVFDLIKTVVGSVKALWFLFKLFPDVVFSKGSYASVPTVLAARILKIPVVIHDCDAIPGRANLWAAPFAKRIAISYPEAVDYFPKEVRDKVALTGNPIRKEILHAESGAHEYLGFSREVPTILILGGSQGAQPINEVVLEALPDLLEKYQVIHQTGRDHIEDVKNTASIALENHPYANRYQPQAYLDDLAMRMAAGAADLIVSRGGSTIFEIAAWKKPALLVPLSEQISRDQRKNSYAAARLGGAVVVEQTNLTPHVLLAEIDRMMDKPEKLKAMGEALGTLHHPDAARKIAEEILAIALKHEG